jgi:hypothetical protein
VTDLTQVMVRRAAELTTAVEMARADMITGVPTDMIALVRLEGVAARAVRVLGLKVEAAPKTPRGLQRARERWAEAEAKRVAAKEAATTPMNTELPDGTAAE